MAYQFECQFCLEEKTEQHAQVRIIDGSEVCSECTLHDVVPRFGLALQTELEYPVYWGSVLLDIKDFGDLVPVSVRAAWPARLREYETPVLKRVYCDHRTLVPVAPGNRGRLEVCGTFLGSTETSDQFQCPKCNSWSKDHHDRCPCAGKRERNAGHAIFDEGTRGVEWQRCPEPTCGVVIERSSGCNHFECLYCGMSFCYICGDPADPDSGHWGHTCPRDGQPGDEDAYYDQENFSDSDDAEDEVYESDDDDDLEDSSWLDNLWGQKLVKPSPDADPEDQLNFDASVVTLFQYDFLCKTDWTSPDVPGVISSFYDLLYGLELNLDLALSHMRGYEPTTAIDGVKEAVEITNFRIRHDRLRQGFYQARNAALNLSGPRTVLLRATPARLFEETFQRYMILHAPRFFSDLADHEYLKDRYRALWYDVGREFESKRHEMRAADPEEEPLLHRRKVNFEDTYMYS